MTAKIIDGNKIAKQIREEIKQEISKFDEYIRPGLGVILVGDNEASKIYVAKKTEACKEVGINVFPFNLIADTSEKHFFEILNLLNNEESCDGILVQLPLPESFDRFKVFESINPEKDVDVFTPINMGLLKLGKPRFVPCTPQGISEMLHRTSIKLEGKHVVVINRGDLVGKPLSSMLIQDNVYANATVTICHDRTPPNKLKEMCLAADVIIVAVGIPDFLTPDMVHEGQVVIDVGINKVDGKIIGDVSNKVREIVEWITPCPGGVGPVTVSMLLKNTLQAFKFSKYKKGAIQC